MNSAVVIAILLIGAATLAAAQAPAGSPKSSKAPSPHPDIPEKVASAPNYVAAPVETPTTTVKSPAASPPKYHYSSPASSPNTEAVSYAPASLAPEAASVPSTNVAGVPAVSPGPDAGIADQTGGAMRSSAFFGGSIAAMIAVAAF